MGSIRYGARSQEAIRNRELDATGRETWSDSLEAVYETDPDVIAAVLPPPLEPGPEPLVRLNISTVTMPGNLVFGAGWFGVQACHGEVLGEYPLLMPMTTEQATVGGRETFGEPKKIAEIQAKREGDDIHSTIKRLGFTVAEIKGKITGERDLISNERIDFYFKLLPSPEGPTKLDGDPFIVHSKKSSRERKAEIVEGEVILGDSPLDPVADLPVRKLHSINLSQRATVVNAHTVGTVPAEYLIPFVHQRYDDLSVLGVKDTDE